jgi:UDP-3-O-[3-hydroxymyristoyl] glucosamine N-acyltransferase
MSAAAAGEASMTTIAQARFDPDAFRGYGSVSFIGAPRDGSILYAGKKIEDRLEKLGPAKDCLVFIEEGMSVPAAVEKQHTFVLCDSAIRGYALFTRRIAEQEAAESRRKGYVTTPQGYHLGRDVVLGDDVYIEPGVLIDHGVTIGAGSIVLANSVIRHATIGRDCLIKTNAVIGDQGFTLYTDEDGNTARVFCLGSVSIGDKVEIGSFTTVCRGQNTATTIGAYSKLDDHVHVGHDIVIGKNSLLTAGATIGGYDTIGDGAYIGMNATTRQFVTIEAGACVPMGARVGKDVAAGDRYGVPKHEAQNESGKH